MITAKEHFIAELEPLLLAAEKAIDAHHPALARQRALQLLELVREYAPVLTAEEMRDALNNPTARRIATRLGVQP